jgi:hypothetical protein
VNDGGASSSAITLEWWWVVVSKRRRESEARGEEIEQGASESSKGELGRDGQFRHFEQNRTILKFEDVRRGSEQNSRFLNS